MRILVLIALLTAGCQTWDYKADLVDGCSTRTGYCHSGKSRRGFNDEPPKPRAGDSGDVARGLVGAVQAGHALMRAFGH